MKQRLISQYKVNTTKIEVQKFVLVGDKLCIMVEMTTATKSFVQTALKYGENDVVNFVGAVNSIYIYKDATGSQDDRTIEMRMR